MKTVSPKAARRAAVRQCMKKINAGLLHFFCHDLQPNAPYIIEAPRVLDAKVQNQVLKQLHKNGWNVISEGPAQEGGPWKLTLEEKIDLPSGMAPA